MKKKSFISKIISFFRPFWKYFIITALLYVVIQTLAAFTPYLFGKGVDAIAKGNIGLTFHFLLLSLIVTILQQQVIWYIKEYLDIKYLDVNIDRALSVISLRRMFEFSIGQHINEHSGVKQTIVNKGQNALDGLVNNFIYIMLQNGIQIIVTLVILAIFDWRVAGVATAFILIHILISNRRNHTYFPKIDEVRKKNQT